MAEKNDQRAVLAFLGRVAQHAWIPLVIWAVGLTMKVTAQAGQIDQIRAEQDIRAGHVEAALNRIERSVERIEDFLLKGGP